MDLAAESGHAGVVSRLLRSGILDLEFSGKFGHTAIHDAAAHGHTAVVETLSEAGVDVHAKTAHSETALHLAAHYGHTLTVESLLAVPSGVGSLGVSHGPGWTAVHSAADAGDIETLLVEHGADVNAKTPGGWTPLHFAAKYGREDLVNIFLMAGADATMRATSGLTAYDYANLKGHTTIAERLKAEKNNI
ncbi:ankyrin repeat-containing domain protein [Hyaloscypha sp. PMI_1271]|nr:ankyrin repeat-containing domain protein [Hyaloscypha sp. PMI_1271]